MNTKQIRTTLFTAIAAFLFTGCENDTLTDNLKHLPIPNDGLLWPVP